MRIANGKAMMRVLLTSGEATALLAEGFHETPRGYPHVFVDLATRSASNFLSLSAREFPHSIKVSLMHSDKDKNYPHFLYIQGPRFPKRKDLPYFSPEEVTFQIKEINGGKLFQVARPPMKRPINAGRKPVHFKTKAEKQEQEKAALRQEWDREPESKTEQIAIKPTLSQEDRALLDEAAANVNLKQSVRFINEMKDKKGDKLRLELGEDGKISAYLLME